MTPEESKNYSLALDALEMVKVWPEHAPSWWRLTGACTQAGDGKGRVVDAIRGYEPQSAHARWFKASALHNLTRSRENMVELGRLAIELPDADRWMSLYTLIWWDALTQADDRAAFRKYFLDTGVPGLLARLGGQLAAGAARRPPSGELRRVAIYAQHLAQGAHAGTAMVFNLRAVLETAGIQTRVYSSQELALPSMSGYSALAQTTEVPEPRPATWQLRIPGNASVTYSDARFSIRSRWKTIAQQIESFEPDLLLFVGFASPLLWLLRERFPILGMSVHTVPPLAPVDVWLCADANGAHWPGLPAPGNHLYPFRFWPGEPKPASSRSAVQVPEDAVLLVTTGNRLEREMPAAWCAEMAAFLEAHPRSHWLLIGVPQRHHAHYAGLHPRIRALIPVEDLRPWLAVCDVYVNPPRIGGGASVAMAMELAVPVLSLAGSDGGDKLGTLAAPSPAAFWTQLKQWVDDPQVRREAGEALKQRFRSELDLSSPEASQGLLEACRAAQRCFERRQPSPETMSDARQ
jgi:hypothetical protein